MISLASRLPEIELLQGEAHARAARGAPPAPWRAAPLPDIERIGVPLRPPARPAPRPAPPRRRDDRPAFGRLPVPRRPPAAPRAAAAATAPPAPRPPAGVPAAAELEIPPFLLAPRSAPRPAPPDPPAATLPRVRRRDERSGPRWGRIGVAAAVVTGLAALVGLAGVGPGAGPGDRPPGAPAASVAPAVAEIPPDYLDLYRRFGREMDIDWRFLAAIGGQESDHGRNPWASRVNADGCIGPMQLGVGGRCGDFVGAWGVDGDGDGRVDPLRPADAIATAARGLRLAKGAPPSGGSAAAYRRAACGYYGACADARADYADEVMARAARYGFRG